MIGAMAPATPEMVIKPIPKGWKPGTIIRATPAAKATTDAMVPTIFETFEIVFLLWPGSDFFSDNLCADVARARVGNVTI
jgi:hypothetical protein